MEKVSKIENSQTLLMQEIRPYSANESIQDIPINSMKVTESIEDFPIKSMDDLKLMNIRLNNINFKLQVVSLILFHMRFQ